MRVERLLHSLLKNVIHQKQIKVLGEVVSTVVEAKVLSVTGVGRRMKNRCQTRSNIRKVDRLYSNTLIARQRLYSRINQWLLRESRPLLVIDGSKLPNSNFYLMRASVARKGRALVVYETIYSIKEQGSRGLYQQFLNGLQEVLPTHCQPILVTDAEFRVPWFKLVEEKGWDFIGRVRGNKSICIDKECCFTQIQALFPQATSRARHLGYGQLNKQVGMQGHFYLYKGACKGRHAHTRSGRHSQTQKSQRYARSAKEPWLLFSSLKAAGKELVRAYRLRMTIEENFRDMKSGRYGLGLTLTRSRSSHRYNMMLLVAMLAQAIAYLVGTVGEMKQQHYQFQANSIKSHRVLSRFFLGCEMLYRKIPIWHKDILQAIRFLEREVACKV